MKSRPQPRRKQCKRRNVCASACRTNSQGNDTRQEKKPDNLGFGPGGHNCTHYEKRPQQHVLPERSLGELVRTARDNRDYRRTYAIKCSLHAGEPNEAQVKPCENNDDDERRYDKSDRHESRSVFYIPPPP